MKLLNQILNTAQELAGTDRIIKHEYWTSSCHILITEKGREIFIRTIGVNKKYRIEYFRSLAEYLRNPSISSTINEAVITIK